MGETRLSAGAIGTLSIGLKGALLCLLLGAPPSLWAHASLVKSEPAQRAVLYRAPPRIRLWFNERLEPRYSSFVLTDATGKPMEMGAVAVGGDDPKSLSAAIGALPPGRYVVKYRVLSTDGHLVQNQFTFTIRQ